MAQKYREGLHQTWRLTNTAKTVLLKAGIEVDVRDLSLLTSSYRLNIHLCKGCVSTAMHSAADAIGA